ncbi:MAG TPA: hypothetical protein VIT67_19650 [Povalibacter sp.]
MWANIAGIAILLLTLAALIFAALASRALEKGLEAIACDQAQQRQGAERQLERLRAAIESVRAVVATLTPVRTRRRY